MKKMMLAVLISVAAFAARANVITNTVVIVSNIFNQVFTESVVTQKVKNTHFDYYYTNHEYNVIHESRLISQTNQTVNLDVGRSFLIAASNQANRAEAAVDDARDFADASAGSASAASGSASAAASSASSAAATRSAAASECASALATINARINWFDQHSGETITQVNYNYTTNLYFAEDSVARSAASAASASASANAASIASLESRVGDNISTLQTRMGTAEGDISGLKSRMSSAEDKINCPIKKFIYSIYRQNSGSGTAPIEMGYITVNAGKFSVFSRTDTVLKLRYDFTYTKLNTSAAVYIGYVEKQFNTAASSDGDKAITSIQFSIGNGQPYYLYSPLAEGHTESLSSITDLAVRPTKSPHRQISAGGLYVGEFWWEANGTETIEVRGPVRGNGSIESPSGSFLPKLVAMKDDVEDRISDVEDSIDSIDTRLSSAESSISANATAIGQHGTRLSSAESSISANATEIGQLGTRVSSVESDILSIQSSISGIGSGSPHQYEHGGTAYPNIICYDRATDDGKVAVKTVGNYYPSLEYRFVPAYGGDASSNYWVFEPAYVDTDANGLRLHYLPKSAKTITAKTYNAGYLYVPRDFYWQNGVIYVVVDSFNGSTFSGRIRVKYAGTAANAYPNGLLNAQTGSTLNTSNYRTMTFDSREGTIMGTGTNITTFYLKTEQGKVMPSYDSVLWIPEKPSVSQQPIVDWLAGFVR